jgi:molecular chaperone DnaK
LAKEEDKVQVGRLTPDTKRLAFKTQLASEDEFVKRFAAAVVPDGMVLKDPGTCGEGVRCELFIMLQDGRKVLEAVGRVVKPAGLPAGKILFQFESLEEPSRGLHARMLEIKLRAEHRDLEVQAKRTGHEAGRTRGHLEDSLRRMVRIDEVRHAPSLRVVKPQVSEGPVIGIDLGTSNSCCALVKGERPFVIPSRRGHNTIPSVVAMTPMGEVVVGHAARAQLEIHPERTIYGSKRLVGRPFDSPVVQQVRDRFHYAIVAGANGEAAVKIGERILSLQEVSGKILEEMRSTAEEYLGRPVSRAVITVPAYYNENQRSAVRQAGELAGLTVERIVNEPTAAALTYGYNKNVEKRILVFDLGGGTFDASLLNLYGNVYEVIATAGDTFLGGVDFDSQLMDHILIEFQLQLGRMPEMERVSYLRVLQGAEFAKIGLSGKAEIDVVLPYIGRLDGKPVDLQVKVTREQLERLVSPLVRRTIEVCDRVLEQAKMQASEVDEILLVGGQTRMPMVHQAIRERFGREPIKGVHPDECVATGAALLGHSMDQIDSVVLIDTLPISIGIGVPGGPFRKVFSAGTQLPGSQTYGLLTYEDGQTELHLPVYQGESTRVDENELLGTVELKGIVPGAAGSRQIEVTFSLSAESLLTVSARDSLGVPLADVTLSAKHTLEELRRRLGEVPAEATPPAEVAPACCEPVSGPAVDPKAAPRVTPRPMPAADPKAAPRVTPRPMPAAAPRTTPRPTPGPASGGSPPVEQVDQTAQVRRGGRAGASKGFWGWLKRLFGGRR